MGKKSRGKDVIRGVSAFVCLVGIVVTWVAMAEILQNVQQGNHQYHKPYFMSFLVHSSYVVFFAAWVLWQPFKYLIYRYRMKNRQEPINPKYDYNHHRHEDEENLNLKITDNDDPPYSIQYKTKIQNATAANGNLNHGTPIGDPHDHPADRYFYPSPLADLKKHWIVSFCLATLGFVTVYTWYISLPLTYVSVNTAIYNCACIFVFFFSIFMLGERISVLKVVSVIVCTAGALLLMVPDLVDKDKKKDQNSNPIGYVLVVVSTILYACWEVCYKKFAKMGYDKKDQQSKSGVHKNEKEKENKKEKKESEKEGADIKNNENGFSAHSGDEEDDIDNDDETRPFLSNNHNHNDNKHNSINYNAEEDEEEEEEGKNFSSKNLESGMTNKTMTTTTSSTQPQKEEPSSKSAVWAQLRLLEETLLFLGLVGVYTLLLSWPGIIVVHYAGFEKFELPTGNALYGIIITMGLDSLFNILLMLAIFLSSPLFISVGSLMTIPASVLADYVFHDEVLAPVAYGGMACIISGFLGMSLSEYITHIEHKLPERRRNLIKRLL